MQFPKKEMWIWNDLGQALLTWLRRKQVVHRCASGHRYAGGDTRVTDAGVAVVVLVIIVVVVIVVDLLLLLSSEFESEPHRK